MRLSYALMALIVAFPLLYVGAALLRSETLSAAALVLVAVICYGLLLPERKK